MDEPGDITVRLPESDELRHAVAAGEYPNAEAAVGAAVESWTTDRMIARLGRDVLRRHWEEGLASGHARPLDPDDLMRDVTERIRRLSGTT